MGEMPSGQSYRQDGALFSGALSWCPSPLGPGARRYTVEIVSRILIAGLPRSGTTWLARIMASAPGVRYVNEPDNWEVEPLAVVGWRGLGEMPVLAPGDRADNYRLMWEFAFAGGWPSSHKLFDRVRRASTSSKVPRSLKHWMLSRTARAVARGKPAGGHQLVKSVLSLRSIEWVAHEFSPAIVIAWRHPLNLVPAWRERGWKNLYEVDPDIRDRFENTVAWPPPTREGFERSAWIVCAESVLLFERIDRHPDWLIVSHERQCLDPPGGFRNLFDRLGLEWTGEVEERLGATNNPGSGYETNRRSAEEPLRWKFRLSAGEQAEVLGVIDRFQQVSTVAAALWLSSPAVSAPTG